MGKEIVKAEDFALVVHEIGMDEVRDLIAANIGSEEITGFDLPRAINPSGKGTKFTIPDIDGQDELTDQITGVIVYHKLGRNLWSGDYKGGGERPLCSSVDGVMGEGDPGGNCAECPFSKFGPNREKPKCKVAKQIFMIREGELLPLLVNVTAVNINEPRRYLLSLLSKKRLKFNHVISRIKLEPAKSSEGFDYAKTVFSMVGVLSPEQRQAMEEMTAIFAPLLAGRQFEIVDEEHLKGETATGTVATETFDDPIQDPRF